MIQQCGSNQSMMKIEDILSPILLRGRDEAAYYTPNRSTASTAAMSMPFSAKGIFSPHVYASMNNGNRHSSLPSFSLPPPSEYHRVDDGATANETRSALSFLRQSNFVITETDGHAWPGETFCTAGRPLYSPQVSGIRKMQQFIFSVFITDTSSPLF